MDDRSYKTPSTNNPEFGADLRKGFQSLSIPLIQNKATCESVKHIRASNSYLGARLSITLAINLAKRSADSNSRRGMVCTFKGDTRVLDTTKLGDLCSSELSTM